MSRDMDLVRSILLHFESSASDLEEFVDFSPLKTDPDKLGRHLVMMSEKGLIEGLKYGDEFQPRRMTWAGYDFLDTIRDDKIWANTKKIGNRFGAFTLELLTEIAIGLIRTKIKLHAGIDI